MPDPRQKKQLLVLTGDHSADGHAASFIRALRELEPDSWNIAGVGGVAMQAEPGVEMLSDHSQMGVIGIGGVISAVPSHRALARKILDWCDRQKPDVAVLIDYGVFHLWLAPKLRARGIKVMYFIPPQIWASRPWRIGKLKRAADEVLVILPFEEAYYRLKGIPATFVGNPLAARLPPPTTKAQLAERFGFDAGGTLIGVFPGSRKLEIGNLLAAQIGAAKLLNAQSPGRFTFALSKARNLKDAYFNEMLTHAGGSDLPWLKIIDDNHALLSASDLVLAASGTLTLEAALFRTPMVVMYRGPWYAYAMVKLLMTTEHISLPNNVFEPPSASRERGGEETNASSPVARPSVSAAVGIDASNAGSRINAASGGRRIVPELWQYEVTPERIAEMTMAMLEPVRYARMKDDLDIVARQFQDAQTPVRVAQAVARLATGGHSRPTP